MKNVSWFDVPDDMSTATKCQTVCSSLSPKGRMILSKAVWVISTARNAVVVVVCALMAYGFDPVLPDGDSDLTASNLDHMEDTHKMTVTHNTTFILTGNIQRGLPAFQAPPFSTNVTDGHGVFHYTPFSEMVGNLGSAIIILPLIIILENVAIAKAFGKWNSDSTNLKLVCQLLFKSNYRKS